MDLPAALLALMLKHAPPGHTAFSLAPAADCAPHAAECPDAQWGEFYGWTRRETAEQGEARYDAIARDLVDEARALLCVDADGSKLEGCKPYPGALGPNHAPRWTVAKLALAGLSVAQMESGFREDVEVGRGRAKAPSDDGGRGRGPSGEACLVQAHPKSAWRFADADPELRARAAAGDRVARETIAQSLLGLDDEALHRCWRVGLRMLVRAHDHCEWLRSVHPEQVAPEWDYAMFSQYGTGDSCIAYNAGKTAVRASHFRMLVHELGAGRKPPQPVASR